MITDYILDKLIRLKQTIVLLCFLLLFSCKPEYRPKVEGLCNCTIIKFGNLTEDLLIVTRQSDEMSNIYSKKSNAFILDNWYEASYNELNEMQHYVVFYGVAKTQLGEDVKLDIDERQFRKLNQAYFNKLVSEQIEKEDANTNEQLRRYKYDPAKTCSWCHKTFKGSHYAHIGKLADCYSTSSSNSIGKYCSIKCCSESRRHK